MNKTLVIVGMHRSGTSLTASILQECGLDIGKELMPDGKGNVKGHFENMDFYRFHMRLLSEHGEHPDGWVNEKIQVSKEFFKEGRALIERNESARWGWKDPRTTLFLGYWSKLLPKAKYLFVYRKPWEVVNSMEKRNTDAILHNDPEVPIKSWLHYNQLMIEHYDKYRKKSLLVDIDTVINHSELFIRQLNDRLGFDLTVKESKRYDHKIFSKEVSRTDERLISFKEKYPDSFSLLDQLDRRAWIPGKDIDAVKYRKYKNIFMSLSDRISCLFNRSNIKVPMRKILVIQTAFIGDAILATAVLEKLHAYYPYAKIHFLVRKGNESICADHPFVNKVFILDKRKKYKSLIRVILDVRKEKYDVTVNLQRFFTTGLITVLSGAKETTGFKKNPLSFLFTHCVEHQYSSEEKVIHEVDRNQTLIAKYTDELSVKPKLYPAPPRINLNKPYVCMAPYSVWFTKQYPLVHWIALVKLLAPKYTVYLMGAPSDKAGCDDIIKQAGVLSVVNLAGTLSLLDSAGVMKEASMNFVNDSAPLHLASAVNAPVAAFFCSTVPAFGFTPLSDRSWVFETTHSLSCKPCGLHGKKSCPEGHFKCGDISPAYVVDQLALLR